MGCRYLAHSLSDRRVICRVMLPRGAGQIFTFFCVSDEEFLDVTRSIADPGNGMGNDLFEPSTAQSVAILRRTVAQF
jgi:hypothetical protein